MTALLFIGKPDYDAVKPFQDDLLLRKTLGLARLRPLKPCAIALTLPKIVGRSLPEFTGGVCLNLRKVLNIRLCGDDFVSDTVQIRDEKYDEQK